MARGRLRIYLGAAPGVGKTYAMLQEGQRLRAQGADVVAGLVEAHGRRPTAALAEGLQAVPRRRVAYRGAVFTEMDLDALLARRPQAALVDELAHTNVPGSRNAKRWQDVEELLDAGIDVVTTLNIQHLESLADVVRQITGVRQRETLPDEVARRADQIELVDLPPEAVRRRMVHGDIYPPDRIDAALTHYFRPGNLAALRELALLWLADRVEEGLQRYRAEHGIGAPWETRERILVGLTGGPEGETLVRRAARISARTPGSELLALHVVPGDELPAADAAALAGQRRLVESLGGSYHQTTGEDAAAALLQFAEAEDVTQIVLGATRRGPLSSVLRPSVGRRTIHGSGAIDVHIVPHERAAGRAGRPPPGSAPAAGRGARPGAWWSAAVLLPGAAAAALLPLGSPGGLAGTLVLGLLVVGAAALRAGLLPALAAAVTTLLLAGLLFARPYPAAGSGAGGQAALGLFAGAAVVVAAAGSAAARRTRLAVRAATEARILSRLATALAHGEDLPALLEQVRETFGLASVSLLGSDTRSSPQPRWYIAASAGERPPERPYDADVEAPVAEGLVLAGRGGRLGTDNQRVLDACAAQLAVAYEHGALARRAAAGDTLAAAERTRASLLLAAGRDLRAPLRSAQDALDRLAAEAQAGADAGAGTRRLAESARSSVRRALQLVTDLDDLSRLQAGALELYLRPVDLDEALTAALDDLGPGGHTLSVGLPEQTPDVIADASLLTRVLTALAADALRHSPPEQPPVLRAEVLPGAVRVRVRDGGGGAQTGGRPADTASARQAAEGRWHSLALRLCRDLTEAMGGTLEPAPHGAVFGTALTLPASAGGTPPAA